MPDPGSRFEQEAAFADLEAMILKAGSYVAPGDNLRPRTLEATREVGRQQRTNRRIGRVLAIAVLLLVSGFPQSLFAPLDSSVFVHSDKVQERAAELTASAGIEPHWALYEVFLRLRGEQAQRLNGSE